MTLPIRAALTLIGDFVRKVVAPYEAPTPAPYPRVQPITPWSQPVAQAAQPVAQETDTVATAPVIADQTAPVAAAAPETELQKIEGEIKTVAVEFEKGLTTLGKYAEAGLQVAVKYAVPVATLFSFLFPSLAPAATTAVNATELIQNAVIEVEQKYAASGVASGTGTQKATEVLTLTQSAVTGLLAAAGVKANTAYIQSLISAVVAILNVQTIPQPAS